MLEGASYLITSIAISYRAWEVYSVCIDGISNSDVGLGLVCDGTGFRSRRVQLTPIPQADGKQFAAAEQKCMAGPRVGTSLLHACASGMHGG